ncbi:MAG: hypothetical protein AABN33_09615 [Acidobacteriota bacterium]
MPSRAERHSGFPAEGPEAIFPVSVLGCAYAVVGQQSAALQMAEKLLALTDQFSPALVQAAAICSELGDKDRAFELMEKALVVRDDGLLWIKSSSRLSRVPV